MNFEETINKMQEKLGKEEASKIADDIASLLSYENSRNKDIKKRDNQIEKLTKDKEMLIEANGNLLQQVSSQSEEILQNKPQEEEKPQKIDLRSAFDKNGNFIR